ncbi:uncharacterized protein LOC128643546 [Bombina bombina]|uniref:uncharacterized protein LOC128643546 n=1 Tax=Bombina bombina TaxID=8345 RepID=UPI00235AFD0B|nr:uncharacterized protein LOC128643546 [Bombina bombina]XP_053552365.1 uncharacterized protein LOC128643546 [Bombina bombina]
MVRLLNVATPPPGFPSLLEVAHARAGCGVQAKVENGSSGQCSAHGGCLGDGAFQCLLRLKKLEDIEEKDLLWATSRCPMVEDITISLDNYSGISSHLTQWPYLTRLTLHCSGPPTRSLEELLTSLEPVGSRLRYLSLQNLFWHQEGSFSTLLSLCPNLHTLFCHFTPRCRTLSHNEPEPELRPWGDNLVIQTLPHLQNFSLLMEGGDPLNPLFKHSVGGSLVSLMCGSPQLQTISLWELPILLDDVFEVMASFSPVPLRKLRTVSLCRSYITSWGATLLLRSDNELETLDLSHCQEITCRDHHRLIEWVRKEGLDITITWQ